MRTYREDNTGILRIPKCLISRYSVWEGAAFEFEGAMMVVLYWIFRVAHGGGRMEDGKSRMGSGRED